LESDCTGYVLSKLYVTGKINGNESAFVYMNGSSHSDYHNASYVPRFLDEVDNQTLRMEALRQCGGDSSRVQCIFDYIFTDDQLAKQTLKTDKEQQTSLFEISMYFYHLTLWLYLHVMMKVSVISTKTSVLCMYRHMLYKNSS